MNGAIVNLNDLIENMEQVSEDAKIYFSKNDGDFHYITGDIMKLAKKNGEISNLSEWEVDIFQIAKEILNNKEEYILVPKLAFIDETKIINLFIDTIQNNKEQEELRSAINSKEGERKFKNLLVEFNINEEWDKYLEGYYKKQAIQWCNENNLEYK